MITKKARFGYEFRFTDKWQGNIIIRCIWGGDTKEFNIRKFVNELAEEVLGNKIAKMFWAMVIMILKMGNLGLEVKSFKTILTIMEEEKQGLLKQIKEQKGYEE